MRVLTIVLLGVALVASSGCFGKDDDDGGAMPTPTPTGNSPTPTPTGATPTTTPTGPTPTPSPTPVAPRELCAVTFDFSGNAPTPPETSKTTPAECGTMPMGYTKLMLNVTFSSDAPVWATNGVFVDLVDGTGVAIATCNGPAAPGPSSAMPCSAEASASPGAYTLAYRGAGNVKVAGNVIAS